MNDKMYYDEEIVNEEFVNEENTQQEVTVIKHTKEKKRGRVKRQKYSVMEQKGYFEEYREFFKLMVFGMGGVCFQYVFGELLKEKIEKSLHDTRKVDIDETTRKGLDIIRYNSAVSRLVKKLEEVQLVEVIKIGSANLIRALPKLLRLLDCDSKTIIIRKEKILKSAILSSYYLQRNGKLSINQINEIVKQGNLNYFNRYKNVNLLENMQRCLEEIGISTNWVRSLIEREKNKVDKMYNPKIKEHGIIKLANNDKEQVFAEVKTDNGNKKNKNFKKYSLDISSENLTGLSQKDIYFGGLSINHNTKWLYANTIILNPSDNLSNYEIAKKIAIAGIFVGEKLLPELNGYRLVLRLKIFSMRNTFSEEDKQEIINHIVKFDENWIFR